MSKIYFNIEDDALIKETPMPQFGETVYKAEVVISKEAFIECYEKWIKKSEDKEVKNET